MNGRLISLSFYVIRPSHSWDKAILNFDLETSRSRSWVLSKGKVIQLVQYPTDSFPLRFTSVRPTIPEILLFRNLTLKKSRSMSSVGSKMKVTRFTQYLTDALPFWFISIGSNIPEIWQLCFIKTTTGLVATRIARFMGPPWGPPEADRTQVGPMLAQWTLLSGNGLASNRRQPMLTQFAELYMWH